MLIFSEKLMRIYLNKHRSIIESFVSLSILQGFAYLIPLIILPYLVRVLGIEKYGSIYFVYAIIIYLRTIIAYGFAFNGTKKIAQAKDNLELLENVFNNIFFTKLFLLIISLLLLFLLVFFIPIFYSNYYLFIVSSTFLLGEFLTPIFFFQGIEKMRYITIFSLIGKGAYLFLTLFFVKKPDDYILVPLFEGGGLIFSGILSIFLLRFKYKIRFFLPKFSIIAQELKDSGYTFLTIILPNLYTNTSTLLLGVFSGNSAVGYFNAILKPINVISSFNDILTRTFFPFLSKNQNAHKKYKTISLIINVLGTIILLIFGNFLLKFIFNGNIHDTRNILWILIANPIALSLISIYGANYLIVKGRDKDYFKASLFASIFGLFGAMVLIWYFGLVGAAFNLIISRFVLAFFCYYFSKTEPSE
jgi:PST family polysaccharide transporter